MFQKLILPSLIAVLVALVGMISWPETAVAKDTFTELEDFKYVLGEGIMQGMVAKEMCSCRYVTGIPLESCKKRSPLPDMAFSVIALQEHGIPGKPQLKAVTVHPAVPLSTVPAMAIYDTTKPRKGCQMAYGMRDYRDGYR